LICSRKDTLSFYAEEKWRDSNMSSSPKDATTSQVHGVTMSEATRLLETPPWRTSHTLKKAINKWARRYKILPAFLAAHACLIQQGMLTPSSVKAHARRMNDYIKQVGYEWDDLLQRSIFALVIAELGADEVKRALGNARKHLEEQKNPPNFKNWVVLKGYLYGATDEKSRSRNTLNNVHFMVGMVGRMADDFPDDVSPAEAM
jgi:hypothetical protein